MQKWNKQPSFSEAFRVQKGDVICFTGAGGKTSLMFRLAAEAKSAGWKVLVTTTTRILFPEPYQYDRINLGGEPLTPPPNGKGCVQVIGTKCPDCDKICGVAGDLLQRVNNDFDLLLIEADGAAGKQLKGWKESEPVIPEFSTKTIGILDIQAVNKTAGDSVIHRLELFTALTGAGIGEPLSPAHLHKVVTRERGLFQHAAGEQILYLNKMESDADFKNGQRLRALLDDCLTIAGSVHHDSVYL